MTAHTLPGPVGVLDRVAYALLCAFLFTIPWDESPRLGGFSISLALGLGTSGIALLRLGVTWQMRKLSTLHYLMMSLVGFSVLSLLWTVDWESTSTRAGTYLQLLAVVWLIWELAATELRVLGLLRAYVLGIFPVSLLTIYNFMTGTSVAKLWAMQGVQKWGEARFSIDGVNENDLGLMLAMSIPITIYLAIRASGRLEGLMAWTALVACAAAILLTGSRGALISAVVAATMLPLVIRQLPGSQKLTAAVACVAVAACGLFFIPPGIWVRLLQIPSELMDGTLTHRTVIWSAGLAALRDHAFLGVGSGAYAATILSVVDVPYVAHNTFLSVLVELGTAGALLLTGLLGGLFASAFRMRYLEKCLWLTVLLSWAVGVMALTWEYRKPTWVMFGLLAAHAYARRTNSARPVAGIASIPSRSDLTIVHLPASYYVRAPRLT